MYTYNNSSAADEIRATNMDEQLKLLAIQNWTAAIDFSIKGNMESCFTAYKSLYHLIEPYDFENKSTIKELVETLTEFVQNFKSVNNSSKINRQTKVILSKQQYTFEQLLGVFMSELPKAYHSLNLWFKSVTTSVDEDVNISQRSFNTNYTNIEGKKKEMLKKLSKEEIFDLFTINDVHKLYAKYRHSIAV